MIERGRFITLEGGEGTGKSTLISGLKLALEARGHIVITTREPGGTPLAEQVRALALTPPKGDPWTPLGHALLMNTARDDLLTKLIRPALARGTWVLSDRFADSTRAYQSIDGVAGETLLQIERIVVGATRPDLTLILDAKPADLAQRRQTRGIKDVFENKELAFHDKVRDAFLSIVTAEPERCKMIDALQAPEAVLKAALVEIDQKMQMP